MVDYRGGASTRAGTRYVATSATPATTIGPDTALPPRLIGFTFSTLQTYVLEFGLSGGAGYIAFYKNGAPILLAGVPYSIVSPYAPADLPTLKFTQSADVMTLVHPSYAPRQLNRLSDTNWTLTTINFTPAQQPPTGGAAVATHGAEAAGPGDATTTSYGYVITAVSVDGEESEAGAIFSNAANSRIMSQDGNAYVTVTWVAPAGTAPAFYNVYRQAEVPNAGGSTGMIFGLVGSASALTFVDRNGIPDFTTTPPLGRNPFAAGNNPGETTYFAQRQWFAGSFTLPETLWASRIGSFPNFDVSQPVQASDAITATIASTQVNAVKHMVPMTSGIVVLSSGGAWLLSGGQVGQGGVPGPITPSSLVAQPQAYNGCSDVPPIVINYDIVYVQAKGSIVRDLSYNFYVNIYTGADMTTLSNHLFAGRAIREWAYAEEPYKIVWAVRDDGILLAWTYVKAQEVYAWTRHDTDGLYQSVCSVSEGPIDAVYFVVKRFLNGNWYYVIERQADRSLIDGNPALNMGADIEKSWCVDCGLSLPQPAFTQTLYFVGLTVPNGITNIHTLIPTFSGGDLHKIIRANGGVAQVQSVTSSTDAAITTIVAFPAMPDESGTTIPITNGWTMTAPVTTLSGLGHLAGRTVSILADGNVVAQQVVSGGGTITLATAASSVVVGLPYTCQLQTLGVDIGDNGPGGTIQGRQKKIQAIDVWTKDARGLKAGRTLQTLVPMKELSVAPIPATVTQPARSLPLVTGIERVVLDPLWSQDGQMWLQVDTPVPATVLGCALDVSIGG